MNKKNLLRIAVGAAAISALAIAATDGGDNGEATSPERAQQAQDGLRFGEAFVYEDPFIGHVPAGDPAFPVNPFTGEGNADGDTTGEEGTPTTPTYDPGTPGTYDNTGGNADHPTSTGDGTPVPTGNIPELPAFDLPSKPTVVIHPNVNPCNIVNCGGAGPVIELPAGVTPCGLVGCGNDGQAPHGPVITVPKPNPKLDVPVLTGILWR